MVYLKKILYVPASLKLSRKPYIKTIYQESCGKNIYMN